VNESEHARARAGFGRWPNRSSNSFGVSRSTMMGFPCLRLNGDFFASCDRRTGNLVVKLDEAAVSNLIADGKAEPFAPNGRRFREWASIPVLRHRSWPALLDQALQIAAARVT
jgi:hypothetical protein